MFLTRIIYASTITEHFNPSSLEEIIEKAVLNNKKNNVTGMLCFNRNYFLQCIEGSRTNVNKTYNKILNDKRHTEIILLDYSEINAREFSNWSMGYVPTSRLSAQINLKFSGSSEFSPYKISAESAYMMMLELKNSLPTV
ncbi:BLUF domain-containing protein [Pseudoalteromonas ostreae]|uniref:BLUF domain-containing protein n=1 Tax=Pseudoalteromonas ostreae TaxID=2774154 RepID=UPI001B395618|nr:BLUF domain-containing protein [Pseudoalteromonas ostreae]